MGGVRRLFIPGYYAGFSNQRMSLDIAVILAHLTGRVLVPYRFREPPRPPVIPDPRRGPAPLRLLDLFEIPVAWSDELLLKTWINAPGALDCPWPPVYNSVFCPAGVAPEGDRFLQFSNGRPHILALNDAQCDAADLHISGSTLGHYSYFMYVEWERRREVVDLAKRIRPKAPYLAVARRIVAALGSFNAVHLRRGDFLRSQLAKMTRSTVVGGDEIVANLATRMAAEDLLVICTDGSPDEPIFAPIRSYFRQTIFLEQWLRGFPEPGLGFDELPRRDATVIALLTQCVAAEARVFAGTLFSTFTALIHRLRAWFRGESRALYCYSDFDSPLVSYRDCEFEPVDDGAFTWNRIRYPVSPDAYSWLREWPECADLSPPERHAAAGGQGSAHS